MKVPRGKNPKSTTPETLASEPSEVTVEPEAAVEQSAPQVTPEPIHPEPTQLRKTPMSQNEDPTIAQVPASPRARVLARFIANIRTAASKATGAKFPPNTSYSLGLERGMELVAAELSGLSVEDAWTAAQAEETKRQDRIARQKASAEKAAAEKAAKS